ncbi:MAG: hypothetical protein IKK58_05120 [Clostridia bacterium]|nr:hypothetical protein [Clostridia bacterium]
MKKIFAILLAVLLIGSMSMVASAEVVAPEGYEVTFVRDFSGVEGTMMSSEGGFWLPAPEADREVLFQDGKVTFYEQNMWGAFFNFTDDELNLFYNKTGWGFYVKNGEYDTSICAGFNGNDGKNYILDEDVAVMFVDMEGNVSYDVTYWGSSGQGAIVVPYEFEGYIYIPFTAYLLNPDGGEYDPATTAILTPIYAISEGEEFTYGEFFVFSSDEVIEMPEEDDPIIETPEASTEAPEASTDAPSAGDPTSEPADPAPANNGWIIWAAIAAAVVVVVVVVVIIIGKKKKA